MYKIFMVKYGNHQTYVAIKHLKCGYYNWGTKILILYNFNEFPFKEPYVASGYCIDNSDLDGQQKTYFQLELMVVFNKFPKIVDMTLLIIHCRILDMGNNSILGTSHTILVSMYNVLSILRLYTEKLPIIP